MPGRKGKAVASFVPGLLGVFRLGLLFGVLALVGIGRTRQKGKALAIVGLVLSGLWTLTPTPPRRHGRPEAGPGACWAR